MQKVIQTKDLARRFGSRWAYARIEFEVLKGERFLLLGANGSGKTTRSPILFNGWPSSVFTW